MAETKNDFLKKLKETPKTFMDSFVRHDLPTSFRTKSQTVVSNFFLHIHSARVHRYSLKKTYTYGLGVIAAISFFILLITGVLLMIYYKPSTALAYDSIKDIQYIIPSGRFLRNAHRWATNIMLIAVFLHMARVFYTAAYKNGRSFNWIIGIILFVLTLALSFTGYLLPWDQLAYWAVAIGSNIAGSFRELTDALGVTGIIDIGGLNKILLLGSEEIGQEALTRFYWLHIMVLPLILVMVLGVHIWRIRKDGGIARPDDINESELVDVPKDDIADNSFVSAPDKTYGLMCVVKGKTEAVNKGPENTISAWPTLFIAEIALFIFTLAIIVILSYFFDAPLKELANPTVPENPAKAPWYFLGLQELISYSAFMGGVGIPTIVMAGLVLIPFLDTEKQTIGRWFDDSRGKTVAKQSFWISTVILILILAFTVKFGWLRNWFPQIPQIIITFINPGTILVGIYMAWSIYINKKYNSFRMGAIALFTSFLVGFSILTYFALYHRGPNWDFFWLQSQWPIH